ncbi:MAG: flagellinolysin, partial [Psychromonas sp.]|nr:flagellinolysin [Psychromonas sp.]
AISTGMTSRINGFNQAVRNANDGVSALQTADGALDSVTNSLQRMRELAVQAANGTNSSSNRSAIQAEISQLGKEINNIAETTKFNSVKLFQRGELTPESDVDKQAVIDGLFSSWFANSEKRIFEHFGISGDGATLKIDLSDTKDPDVLASVSGTANSLGMIANQILTIDMSDFEKGIAGDGGNAPFYSDRIIAHEMVHAVMGRTMNMEDLPKWFSEGTAEMIHGADSRVFNDLVAADGDDTNHFTSADFATLIDDNKLTDAWEGTSGRYSTGYSAVRYLHEDIKSKGGEGIKDVMTYLSENVGGLDTLDEAIKSLNTAGLTSFTGEGNFTTSFQGGAGATFMQNSFNFGNEDTGAIGGADVDGEAEIDGRTVIADDKHVTLTPMTGFDVELPTKGKFNDPLLTAQYNLQVGANSGETITVSLSRIDSEALGLEGIDVTTDASDVITRIDKALSYISDQRAEIGASINRLDASASVNELSAQSTSGSRSRIMDADFATETSKMSKAQILQQAGTSMLSQANASTQAVLSLLA